MLKFLLLGLVLSVANVLSEKVRYDGYTLYKVLPKNAEQIKFLQDLQDSDPRYDFWSDPVPLADYVSILTSPENKVEFENTLKSKNVDFVVSSANIQEAIDKEKINPVFRSSDRNMLWDQYYTQDAINDWITFLTETYPGIVTKIVGGSTYEGREIIGFKISHGEGRKAIFLEGGIHSREWISPATVNFIANELLTSNYTETKEAAHDFDWYIFPVTNPDGYIFTQTNRLWRKNRRPIGDQFGVDLNRNWNNNWLAAGASTNASLDTYAGAGPFSEPETRTLSAYIESIADKIEMYLSFHSFSQLLLLPFGNTTEPLANYEDAMKIGRRAMGALSVRYGTQYKTGNIAEAIYKATGGSVDWVKERLKVPLVYCYELRDNGTHGFLLPPDQILDNNLEVFDSILELIFQARREITAETSNAHNSKVTFCGLSPFCLTTSKYPLLSDEFDGINLERGQTGVFEIEDLVELLQRENSKDIFVAAVPKEIRYVDYICVVSGRNKRHILGLSEFVRKVYKKKCYNTDPIPRIEGKESDEWMALDLGNIALHVFTDKARKAYDLETLWSVGPEYDDQINKKSEVVDMFENYSDYLKDLKPLG